MVNRVTFPAALGGDGKTYSDDADPNTGLDGLGYIERLIPLFQNGLAMAIYTQQYAAKIDAAADDADRAEYAKAYVEAYAGALKNNIQTYYYQFATLKFDLARGKYLVDDGELTETTNAGEVLTVERATPKWAEGPNGKRREVPVNTLARQWRNGVPQGTLIEESRTNLLLWSGDFTNAAWDRTGQTDVSITTDESPIEEVNWNRIEANVTGNIAVRIRQTGISTTGGNVSVSLFFKPDQCRAIFIRIAGSTRDVRWSINVDTEATTSINYMGEYSLESVAGGGYYITVSDAGVGDSANIEFWVMKAESTSTGGASFTAGDGAWIIGAQSENAPAPSSYIPTRDASVTRAADSVSRTLGGEFNAQAGVILANVPNEMPTSGVVFSGTLDVGSRFGIRRDLVFAAYDGINEEIPIALQPGRVAINYAEGQLDVYNNGSFLVSLSTWPVTINTLYIGYRDPNGPDYANSCSSFLSYYPFGMTEAELVELTSI